MSRKRSQSLPNLVDHMVGDLTLFKTKKNSGLVMLDFHCFLEETYKTNPNAKYRCECCFEYVSRIYDQLCHELPKTVDICVFDMPVLGRYLSDVAAAIWSVIQEKGISCVTAETAENLLVQVTKEYRLSEEVVYFVTSSSKRYKELDPVVSHLLLPECLRGKHNQDDLQHLLNTVGDDKEITLALDIDDTVLFANRSLHQGKTCMNSGIFPAIQELHSRFTIKEIVFLTAREAPGIRECEDIDLEMSDEFLEELKQSNPIDIRLVTYYLNLKLSKFGVNHEVNRVLYSNARYLDLAVNRKASLIKRFEERDKWNFILIDNSEHEIQALKELLPQCPLLLPPIHVYENNSLSKRDIQKLLQVFTQSVDAKALTLRNMTLHPL